MKLRTWISKILAAIGLVAVFVSVSAGALILHLDLPRSRRVLAQVLERQLDSLLLGSFRVGQVEQVGASSLVVSAVTVKDPRGRVVLTVSKLTIQVGLVELVRRVAFGGPKITLEIDHAHVTRAEAHWFTDEETGLPSLVDAFTPRPSPAAKSGAPRDVRVAVRAVELSRGYARGAPPGLPTLELDVSQVRGFVLVTSVGAEVSLQRFGVVARGLGGADARGVASLRLRDPGWFWTSFDGYFGDVQVGSAVRIDGDRLTATLDLPKARPRDLRAVLPGFPLQHELGAHFELQGELPASLMLSGRLEMGKTRAFATGPLQLGANPAARLEVSAETVDLASLLPDLPASNFDFSATVKLRAAGRDTTLELAGATGSGTIANVAVPKTELSATWRGGLLTGHALLHEPGLPVRAAFALRPGGVFDLSAEAQKVQVSRVSRFAQQLQTRAHTNLRLVARVEKGRLSADLHADVADFQRGNLKLGRATLSGRARGPLNDPRALNLDGTFTGVGVSSGDFAFSRVTAKVKGAAREPRLEVSILDQRGATLQASATVQPRADGLAFSRLELVVKKEEAELRGRVKKLDVGDGEFELSEFDLQGLGGSVKGSLELRSQRLAFVVSGEKLDLKGLSRMLGLPSHYAAGKLDLDADVLLARDIERGKVSVTLEQGTLGPLADVTSKLHARLEDGRLEGDAEVTILGVGQANARLSALVPGSLRDQKAAKDMVGQLDLELTEVDLSLLGRTLAPGRAPPIQGKLASVLRITRSVPYALPSVAISGYTDGLDVDTSAFSDGGPRFSGIDARFGLNVSGESGETDLSLKLVDRRGVLASASLATTVDLVSAINDPSGLFAQLRTTPLLGKVLLDERPLEHLPTALQLPGASGKVRVEAALTGTLEKPVVSGRVRLGKFQWLAEEGPPFDLCASFGWEHSSRRLGSNGELFLSDARRDACEGRRIAQYALNGSVVASASRGAPRLDGSAVLSLEGVPLAAVPGLGAAGVSGRASGRVSVAQTSDIPSLSATLNLTDTRIHEIPIGDGKLEIRSNEKALGATIELKRGVGLIQATAFAALDYSQATPRLMLDEPIGVRVTAKAADAVVLSPLTRDLLNEISGQVDADLTLALLAPSEKTENELSGKVEGSFALRGGALEFAGFGLKLHEVEIAARAESEGKQTRVGIGTFRGRAGTGRQAVSVRGANLWLDGLRIKRAAGTIDATELPLSFEGIPQATATTRQGIHFDITRAPKEMQARLDIPYLVVALPQSSARNLISLDENRSFEVLQPLGEPRRSSGDSLPWRLSFELGQDVKLTRTDLDLPISGNAEIVLADEFALTGDVDLVAGGRVEVSGKTFVIESGEVHFDTGDAGDPRIRVTANWRAPDGSTVTADVTGTLKKANLSLSSPGRNSQEIYALLLGGSGSAEGGDARAAGAGVGADQLLGPLLANTPLRRVEIRAGSEQTADQRTYSTYSAAVPIGDQLWFEGSYKALNASDSGDANASSNANAWSGSVDWRFRRNWSLRTELGTIGTGVDLLWNYRY